MTNKIVPDALAEIWLLKGDSLFFSLDNEIYNPLPKMFAWGLYNTHSFMYSNGISEIIGIKFHPWAFNLFFDVSMEELKNSYHPLDKLVAEDILAVFEKINENFSMEGTIDAIESLLLTLFKTAQISNSEFIRKAHFIIVESKGSIHINARANQTGVSRQYLNKKFKETTGLLAAKFC